MRGEKVAYLVASNSQRRGSGSVFSTRRLPGGKIVRILDHHVHDKAIEAAKAETRKRTMTDDKPTTDPDGGTLEDFLTELGMRDDVYGDVLKRLKLSDLIDQTQPEHRHPEVDFGRPAGKEV